MRTWTVDDVMTSEVVSVKPAASYRTVVDLLVGRHFSAVPVVDDGHRVIGVVSEADLLRKIEYAGQEEPRLFESGRRRGQRAKALAGTAAELMSHPPVVAPAGTAIMVAARTMDTEGVKRLPVVDEAGRLAGIVTRGDLLKVHLRTDAAIREDVVSGVLGTLLLGAETAAAVTVDHGVVTMTGTADRWSTADLAVRLTRQVAGVVQVVDAMTFHLDDSGTSAAGTGFATV